MKTDICELQNTCKIVQEHWTGDYKPVSLVYTNQSTDHFHSSYEVEIDISKEKAEEMIAFLQKAFDIDPNAKAKQVITSCLTGQYRFVADHLIRNIEFETKKG